MNSIDKKGLMNNMFSAAGMNLGDEVKEIPLDKLNSFHTGKYKHVFSVKDDEDMLSLEEKIKEDGVLEPIIVRPDKDDMYEIVAGHRRVHASKKLGLKSIKALVTNLDDSKSVKVMVLTNLEKRGEIKLSEKAFAYRSYIDANKNQGRRTDLEGSEKEDINKKIEEKFNENERTVKRIARLTRLIPELLKNLDNNELQLISAFNLTFLDDNMQKLTQEKIKGGQKIDTELSKEIKDRFTEGSLRSNNDLNSIILSYKKNKAKSLAKRKNSKADIAHEMYMLMPEKEQKILKKKSKKEMMRFFNLIIRRFLETERGKEWESRSRSRKENS